MAQTYHAVRKFNPRRPKITFRQKNHIVKEIAQNYPAYGEPNTAITENVKMSDYQGDRMYLSVTVVVGVQSVPGNTHTLSLSLSLSLSPSLSPLSPLSVTVVVGV